VLPVVPKCVSINPVIQSKPRLKSHTHKWQYVEHKKAEHSLVGVATGLQAGRPRNRASIISKRFSLPHSIHTGSVAPTRLLLIGYRRIYLRLYNSRGVRVTPHLHLMSGNCKTSRHFGLAVLTEQNQPELSVSELLIGRMLKVMRKGLGYNLCGELEGKSRYSSQYGTCPVPLQVLQALAS
jgi:hypothetical protein